MLSLKIFNKLKKIHLNILNQEKIDPQTISNEYLFINRFHPELIKRYFFLKNLNFFQKIRSLSNLFQFRNNFFKIDYYKSYRNLKKNKILFISALDNEKFINRENQHLNELIKIMTNNSNLKYSILNLSNVYGPRQDPHGEAGVVSIFANKYLNDERPIIYGDGEQTRDYIYVKDVVSALIKASTIDENHFLNIGTGVETSVNELANSMKSQFNSEINPIYKPAREGELNRSVLNNTKAKKELDWKPEYDLDEGMKQVFNWLKA